LRTRFRSTDRPQELARRLRGASLNRASCGQRHRAMGKRGMSGTVTDRGPLFSGHATGLRTQGKWRTAEFGRETALGTARLPTEELLPRPLWNPLYRLKQRRSGDCGGIDRPKRISGCETAAHGSLSQRATSAQRRLCLPKTLSGDDARVERVVMKRPMVAFLTHRLAEPDVIPGRIRPFCDGIQEVGTALSYNPSA